MASRVLTEKTIMLLSSSDDDACNLLWMKKNDISMQVAYIKQHPRNHQGIQNFLFM